MKINIKYWKYFLWYSIAVHSRKHTVRVLICQRVGDCTNSVVYWKKFHFLQLDFDLVKLSNFELWPADNWWKLYILRTRFFPPALSTKLLGWTFAVNPHFVFLLPKRLWSLNIRYMHTDLHLPFDQFLFAIELSRHNCSTVFISNQHNLHI